jgi:hypothetical protein
MRSFSHLLAPPADYHRHHIGLGFLNPTLAPPRNRRPGPRQVGVLTGGFSSCATPNLPDYYGRMSQARALF